MVVDDNAVAESGTREMSPRRSTRSPDPAWVWIMSGLARDGTLEPVSNLQARKGTGKKQHFACSADEGREGVEPYLVDVYEY